jgi:hypothetical protein
MPIVVEIASEHIGIRSAHTLILLALSILRLFLISVNASAR